MVDTIRFFDEPIYQNVLTSLATVIYVKVVIAAANWAVSQHILASKISRKCIHIAAGSWIIFWPFFCVEHWTWRLNILVPAIYTIQLLLKGIFLLDGSSDEDVKTMTRSGSPAELLLGPVFFTIIMCIMGICFFRQQIAVVIMSCLGFGDGVAPLIGYYIPMFSYPTWPFGPTDTKTCTGSLGFFVASCMGYYILKFVIEENSNTVVAEDDFSMIVLVASVAAVTEGISGPYDNIGIAFSAGLTYHYFILQQKIDV